jgi:hypothetical protein
VEGINPTASGKVIPTNREDQSRLNERGPEDEDFGMGPRQIQEFSGGVDQVPGSIAQRVRTGSGSDRIKVVAGAKALPPIINAEP